MKRGTTPELPVMFKGVEVGQISTIDFIFKQIKHENAPSILEKNYPADVSYLDSTGMFMVPFTQEETRLFAANKEFFMDTRITLTNGLIPNTPIISLWMDPTLFSVGDDNG